MSTEEQGVSGAVEVEARVSGMAERISALSTAVVGIERAASLGAKIKLLVVVCIVFVVFGYLFSLYQSVLNFDRERFMRNFDRKLQNDVWPYAQARFKAAADEIGSDVMTALRLKAETNMPRIEKGLSVQAALFEKNVQPRLHDAIKKNFDGFDDEMAEVIHSVFPDLKDRKKSERLQRDIQAILEESASTHCLERVEAIHATFADMDKLLDTFRDPEVSRLSNRELGKRFQVLGLELLRSKLTR